MITIKQFFANLIMEINETFEKIYQAAEENKIFESVYNEFGKLDSLEEKLSPKLKALLAAGLIGTASLGMQSCAQPTDDYTNPAPTEEVKPKDNETPPPAPAVDNNNEEKTRDNGGENTVKPVWKQLNISEADANLLKGQHFLTVDIKGLASYSLKTFLYKDDEGFVPVNLNTDDHTDTFTAIFDINETPVAYCIPSGTKAYTRINELKSELGVK